MINSGRSDLGTCVLAHALKDGVAAHALVGAWARFRDEAKLEEGPMAQLASLLVRVSWFDINAFGHGSEYFTESVCSSTRRQFANPLKNAEPVTFLRRNRHVYL